MLQGPAWPEVESIDRWVIEQEFDGLLHRYSNEKKIW